MSCQRMLIRCAAIADGAGVRAVPGALLLEDRCLVAAGRPESIGAISDGEPLDRPDAVIVPAFVNAHAHLDLSHLGPTSYEGDFPGWIDGVRTGRATGDDAIADAVRLGIELSLAGGTALIGDIAGAGSGVPLAVLRERPLQGVSFLELFGIGAGQDRCIGQIERALFSTEHDRGGVRLGLQPHAPYSCGRAVYETATRAGLPLSTHLSETTEEIEFVRHGHGPLVEMLRSFGVWDETIRGCGRHPVDAVLDWTGGAPLLAAHVNYIDDLHLAALASAPITVAYCPRACAYFGHVSHRYRDMLDAGVNVALGTDGRLCLDTPDRISVLDEMRLLHRRDGVDPIRLLRLATINGAIALGFDPELFTLAPGDCAGLIALPVDPDETGDPLAQSLRRDDAPQWILSPDLEPSA